MPILGEQLVALSWFDIRMLDFWTPRPALPSLPVYPFVEAHVFSVHEPWFSHFRHSLKELVWSWILDWHLPSSAKQRAAFQRSTDCRRWVGLWVGVVPLSNSKTGMKSEHTHKHKPQILSLMLKMYRWEINRLTLRPIIVQRPLVVSGSRVERLPTPTPLERELHVYSWVAGETQNGRPHRLAHCCESNH